MKIKKVISVIVLVVMLVLSISGISNAAVTTEINPSNYYPGYNPLTESDYQVAFNHTSTILNAITTVGIVVAIVTTMVLGIKYMFGSIEQRAEYKKTMIPMLVGAALLFTVSTLVAMIYNIMQDVNK